MATLKTANGRGKYHDLNSRQNLISYIVDPQKTHHHHVYCCHVDPRDPVGDMDRVAAQFGKSDGVQARHFIFHSNPLNWVPIPRPPTSHRRSPPAWAPNIKPCLLFTRTSSICTSTRSSTRSAMWMATDTGAQSRSSIP